MALLAFCYKQIPHNEANSSTSAAQTCWSAAVLWQMSRRPMTSVEGAVMDFASAPGRWLEMSARHDVHVELGKDVGDERSEETRTGHRGVCLNFEHKIQ